MTGYAGMTGLTGYHWGHNDHLPSGFFLADLLNRPTKNLMVPIAVETPALILFTSLAS
jgi:hypothetical protein